MQVILELQTGPDAGRKICLLRGQVVRVGSSAWNDLAVPDDPDVAAEHFVLDVREGICRFQDVSGGLGALVNGQFMVNSILKNGDKIRAGGSEFIVRITGDTASSQNTEIITIKKLEPEKMPTRTLAGQYIHHEYSTGVYSYSCYVQEVPPVEIAKLLHSRQSIFLLVDPRRIDLPELPNQNPPAYLYDWLGEAAAANSPMLLAEEDTDLLSILESSWGRDGVVAIYSKTPKSDLIEILRSTARPKPDRLLGFCWPSLLSPLLENVIAQIDLVHSLFASVSALLVEASDGKAWILYTSRPIDEFLQSHGLKRAGTDIACESADDPTAQTATAGKS